MTTPSAVVAAQQDSDAAATPREGSRRRRLRRRLRPGLGVVFGIAAFLSATLQLLLHPVLGLADNGDYKRILVNLHLIADVPPGQSSSFTYIWLHYIPGGPNGPYEYGSTELLFARVVHKVNDLVGLGPAMDLRIMGVAHALLLGVAVWLIMRAMPGSLVVRCVTGILLVVALTDTRFVVYLDSFFTEPASMLALLFLLAAVLHAWRKPALSPLNILAIVVAGAALVLSKSQNAPLVVPIVALLVARRSAWGRLNGRWSGRLLPAVAAIALLFVAGQYLRNQPAGLDQINRYNAVFVEILGHSRHPADDLRALHLQPELAKYSGIPIYSKKNAGKDPNFAGFYSTATHRRIAKFYLEHPGRALSLGHRGATAAMELKPRGVSPPLGTQTKDSGAPKYYSACKLCLYSAVSEGWRGASAVLLPALWLAGLVLATSLFWTGRKRDRRQSRDLQQSSDVQPGDAVRHDGLAVTLLFLVAVSGISLVTALLGEGEFEIVKHLYLTSVTNAALAVTTISATLLLLSSRRRASNEAVRNGSSAGWWNSRRSPGAGSDSGAARPTDLASHGRPH